MRTHTTLAAAGLAAALLFGACGSASSSSAQSSATIAAPAVATADSPAETSIEPPPLVDLDTTTAPPPVSDPAAETEATESDFSPITPSDELIASALIDLDEYWAEVFPELYGMPWQPISGGYYPYTSESELPPCPGVRDYGDIAENAFYCPAADLVAWDAENLIPQMDESFGSFSLAIVMAHEIGHAVQARFGTRASFTVTREQQADCYAGAWTASVANGYSTRFTVGMNDLDAAIAGFLQLRDHPGSDGLEEGAHGSAFDRIGSFQEGFELGAAVCKNYTDQNVAERLVQLPFSDDQEAASGGNLPWEDVLPLVSADLESFWSAVFAQYGMTWTPIDPTLRADGELAMALYDNIGDFAAATLLGRAYAAEVQVLLNEPGTDLQRSLQADCLTGSWAASMFLGDRPDAVLRMSPGDLDKAVMALLALGDDADTLAAGEATVGTPFQRVASLRQGFMNGLAACAEITTDA